LGYCSEPEQPRAKPKRRAWERLSFRDGETDNSNPSAPSSGAPAKPDFLLLEVEGIRVLIVEDQFRVVTLIEDMLADAGCVVRAPFRDCPKLSTRWIMGPLIARVFYAVVSKIVTKGRFGLG
jgi:hypothetical protein